MSLIWRTQYNSSIGQYYSTAYENITRGCPCIAQFMTGPGSAFIYTTPGHFIVICGIYNVNNTTRIIVADPYPTSDPDFSDDGSHNVGQVLSFIDLTLTELYNMGQSFGQSLICSSAC